MASLDSNPPVAIVTGATRGIGFATAHLLSAQGWAIALVARSESELKETARQLKRSIIIPLDISVSSSAPKIITRTVAEFGPVHALVNNAGIAPMLPVEETSDEIWRQTIDTNLSSAFYLSRAVWPVFKKRGGGVIVNLSSAVARDPYPGFIAYGAAKGGLNTLGLSLAREGAKDNIRVHTIAPSATETAMFRALPGMSEFPREMTMDPEDVARVIVSCVTGHLANTSGEIIYLRKKP